VHELWQEICFILQDISPSIREDMYEQKIIQLLEKLGWSRFRKEIVLKQSVQLGSVGRIIPDIIVSSLHNNESFVIEVKKPSADIENNSHKNQLVSYMRQLKLENGLLIGSKIQIYYDGKSNKTVNPILLKSIDISESNKDGLLFIDLFKKETFSYKNIETYATKRINDLETKSHKNELRKLLLSSDYQRKLKELITEDLHQNWDKETIIKVLNQMLISISLKKPISPTPPVPPDPQPPGEVKIGQLVKSKMAIIIDYCEQLDEKEISKLESATYSKSTFNINFPFLQKVSHNAPKQDRYWKNKYQINGQYYVVTSEWFKGSIPFFTSYIAKISQHQKG